MIENRYVIGIDGGNTKTHYALFDQVGNPAGFIAAGTASHERLNGYEGMKNEFAGRIRQLLNESKINMKDVGFSVLGLAGVDIGKQHSEISKRLKEIGLTNFKVYNDAYLGIKAGSEKGYGICSINGTGTSCTGIDRYGQRLQVGGCGRITGDDAGGGFLWTTAIRIVYESIYKCGEQTIMKEMFFDLLQVTDENLFLDVVYEKVLSGMTDRKLLSKIVFMAANKGDNAALKLLEHVGMETAKAVIGVSRRLDFQEDEEIDIIMAGSIHVKGENPFMLDTFKNEVARNINGKPRFCLLQEPPVAGAVIWALEELNGSVDNTVRKKVLESLILK